MKRCPQCQFIYPDSDNVCDFDQSALVEATESEIAAITNTPARPALAELAATHSRNFANRKNRRLLPVAAAIGIVIGIVVAGVYFIVHRQMNPPTVQEQTQGLKSPTTVSTPSPSSSPSVVTTSSPEPEIVQEQKPANVKTTTAHTTKSSGPTSTGVPGTSTKSNTKQVILLNGGGKVEADEVWRTKDGVWYRRDGVVTLLKKNRVKAILNP
jgi:cytoskeletal protein RodZ